MGEVKMFKRTLIMGNIIALLLLAFIGCKGGDSTEGIVKDAGLEQIDSGDNSAARNNAVEIGYWTVFTGPDGRFMQNIVDEFNKANKGEIIVKPKVIFANEYYSRLMSAVASGTAPDIGIMHTARICEFASKGILLPLDELSKKHGYSEADFAVPVWKAGVVNGIRYGIPLDIHPLGLYYNVDLLNKAGFSKPPETMQEFIQIAQACTKDLNGDGHPDQWGYALTKMMNSNIFLSLLYQYGGKLISEDGSEPAYNSPEGAQVLQFMYDLYNKYKVCPENLSPDEDILLFKQKKIALYVQGIWVTSEFRDQKDLNFETAPIPQFGKKKAVWADSHNLVLFKQRKSDQQKTEATGKFIQYLLEHSLEWAKAGQVPARNEIRNSREFIQMKDQYAFARQEDYLVFPAPTVYYDAIWSPLEEQIRNVLLGIAKPEDALKRAADKARENIKDEN